ncbi:MAG: ABC transporter permease, partial [Deltaproteobacteria bacterium]|nr:ABC transporter permease [Kofleriaceae bacterium]
MSFYVRMALRSLRRTQGLNLVMIAALALGIGTWYAQRQIFTFLDSKIPDAPADLYLVALERGDPVPANRSRDIAPLYPSILLTPRDAQGVLAGGAPRRQTMTFGASALAEPDGAPAERVRVRYATRDFFALFRVPIVQGEPWPATADQGLLAGVATDAALVEEGFARRVFGEGPVVGRRMRIDGADVRIVGVVASYRDGRYHLYERFVPVPDAVYLPLASATAARAEPDFQHVVAGGETGSVYV